MTGKINNKIPTEFTQKEMAESKKFNFQFTVTEDLLDEYGHVNNAQYLVLYERARWKILEMSGLGADMIRVNKTGPVILEVTVRFSKELLRGQRITIETISRRKNELIFLFDQKMINEAGEVASKALFTASLFDLEKRKIIKADKRWLEAFGFAS